MGVARRRRPAAPRDHRRRDAQAAARSYPRFVPAYQMATAPADEPPADEHGGDALQDRAEVRDVLAWMRLLVDPRDASAVVRALARPPIELRQVDVARVIALARRRKLDLVAGLASAIESPQVPPEGRERIQRFLALHRDALSSLDSEPPDVFMSALVEQLGMRERALISPERAVPHGAAAPTALCELARELARRRPGATSRQLAGELALLVGDPGRREAPLVASAPDAPPSQQGTAAGEGPVAEDRLQAMVALLREEVLASVARIGGRLEELRLDTDLDISHGVVRYLELLKVVALRQRPAEQSVAEALADLNARLLAAATPLQREILQTSTLDDELLAATAEAETAQAVTAEAALRARLGGREEPSLDAFLPRKGAGLALSASDIETYRACPLRYKFARVLRVPIAQTVHQRFGITVHRVLERYHVQGGETLAQMLELLDAAWCTAGFGDSDDERRLRDRARAALARYHERLGADAAEPVWFERPFVFQLGPHQLRGRVDRVDRLAADSPEQYELIDYKTSRPKTAAQLQDDVQLSLYALAAGEAWQLPSSRQAYHYVLDDRKVPVPRARDDLAQVKEIVRAVGDGILAQRFEPTPSRGACSICDYRLACPAAER
jgi:RecB family exonuclease